MGLEGRGFEQSVEDELDGFFGGGDWDGVQRNCGKGTRLGIGGMLIFGMHGGFLLLLRLL